MISSSFNDRRLISPRLSDHKEIASAVSSRMKQPFHTPKSGFHTTPPTSPSSHILPAPSSKIFNEFWRGQHSFPIYAWATQQSFILIILTSYQISANGCFFRAEKMVHWISSVCWTSEYLSSDTLYPCQSNLWRQTVAQDPFSLGFPKCQCSWRGRRSWLAKRKWLNFCSANRLKSKSNVWW